MKTAILLVAYGSSNPGSRAGLAYFENLCRQRFPGLPLRWAYSSALLRQRLAGARQKSDSVEKAIMRLHFENFKAVAIQPLHTIQGREHEAVIHVARKTAYNVSLKCTIGSPLLTDSNSISIMAKALLNVLPAERKQDEDVIFMGHGAKHIASAAYEALDTEISRNDAHIHVASMSGPILLDHILARLSSQKVWLFPLLSVVGRHVLHDMAGNQSNSWKMRIEAKGHKCIAVLQGMAQWDSICNLWLNSLANIL